MSTRLLNVFGQNAIFWEIKNAADLHLTASEPDDSQLYQGRTQAFGSGEGPGSITGQLISESNANKVATRR